MNHTQKSKKNCQWREGTYFLRLLNLLLENISEFLFAAIWVGEDYPELADAFEQMAEEEAAQFRMMGQVMLQNGMDPVVKNMLRNNGTVSRKLISVEENSIEQFLRDMEERTVQLAEEFRRALSLPRVETSEETRAILDGRKEQLKLLRRMLS